MVVQANHDIEAGDEITLPYAQNDGLYRERKECLDKLGFQCSCPLCKVESGLPVQLRQMEELGTQKYSVANSHGLEGMLRKMLHIYSHPSYKGLPFSKTILYFYGLAHCYLGPVFAWSNVRGNARTKAADCFLAILELGTLIKLVKDTSSPYCELWFSKGSQPHPYGVAALVGLAELAFTSPETLERRRAGQLIKCAKFHYMVIYGENATFEDHYPQYKSKAAFNSSEDITEPPGWEQRKAMAAANPSSIPAFLR